MFQRAEFIQDVVGEYVVRGVKAIWIQEGIVKQPAAMQARGAGMTVIMDRCVYRDFKLLCS